jgi:hypothetical protein
MPPYFKAKCTNCDKMNQYDLAEIKKDQSLIEKTWNPFHHAPTSQPREYKVVCTFCHVPFVIEPPED